jgi:hypothetical protein
MWLQCEIEQWTLQCGMKNVAYCGMEHGTQGSAVMWNVTLGSMVLKYVDWIYYSMEHFMGK